jgi:hypothetical protein
LALVATIVAACANKVKVSGDPGGTTAVGGERAAVNAMTMT